MDLQQKPDRIKVYARLCGRTGAGWSFGSVSPFSFFSFLCLCDSFFSNNLRDELPIRFACCSISFLFAGIARWVVARRWKDIGFLGRSFTFFRSQFQLVLRCLMVNSQICILLRRVPMCQTRHCISPLACRFSQSAVSALQIVIKCTRLYKSKRESCIYSAIVLCCELMSECCIHFFDVSLANNSLARIFCRSSIAHNHSVTCRMCASTLLVHGRWLSTSPSPPRYSSSLYSCQAAKEVNSLTAGTASSRSRRSNKSPRDLPITANRRQYASHATRLPKLTHSNQFESLKCTFGDLLKQ